MNLLQIEIQKNIRKFTSAFFLMLMINNLISAEEIVWPKVIKAGQGEITVYQPQPESLDGVLLSGRAAVSAKHKDSKRPVFGAIWISTTLEVDRDSRIAVLTDIKIPNIRFSGDLDDETIKKISDLIESEMPKWDLKISMDDLIATLESSSAGMAANYKNEAPEIIISYKPAVLVFIDGDPVMKKMDNSDFQRIENTPFFIIQDVKKKEFYIYSETHWLTSSDLNGKWEKLKKESNELKNLRESILKENPPQEESDVSDTGEVPEVIVRTSQAELIAFNGEPVFKPVENTNLLYVENTTEDVFMDIESQRYFILVSGRWYSSKDIEGPWEFINSDKLPADFAKIPEGSDKDIVLASVAGTNAARDAVLDSQIPQTAEVDRKTATVKVEFDGEPKFEKVEGTSMLYAVNSPQTVLKVNNRFYCVDNGIWFVSNSVNGPWQVSDTRPEDVEEIQPSSPVYNVKYVYIYDSTPDVVYVGYTPGYFGSYVYGPTVIYGTGYFYRPWYGAYYYPRPVTWGFSMRYNPYTGWSIGFSTWPVYYGFGGYYGGYYGGYWGCPAYRPHYHYHYHGGGYYRPGYGNNNRPGYDTNRPPGRPSTGTSNRPSTRPSTGVQTRPSTGIQTRENNLYGNNRAGVNPNKVSRPAVGSTSSNRGTRDVRQPANDVYTDKSGNVYKKTNKGWEQRDGNNWKPADKTSSRPSVNSPNSSNRQNTRDIQNRPNTGNISDRSNKSGQVNRSSGQSGYNPGELNKQAADRYRGSTRTSNYNNYSGRTASPSKNMGSGMQRSGAMPRSTGGRR